MATYSIKILFELNGGDEDMWEKQLKVERFTRNKLAYFQKRLINIIALYKNKFCFHLKPIGLCNVCRHFAAPERSSLSGILGCHICKCFLQNLRDRQSNWATANQQTFIVSRQSLQRSMAPLSPFHEISSLDLGKHVNRHIEKQAMKVTI
ncbi:hypothetical protein SELMODRAFT_432231 [Selaginella moellendorffii]|uniref:Uncharacterized protein n=1 Tax=Selaginella moellendorffii TaxID=88036 RepID=D8TFD4_SELML|nr:hypothetical protein SELMODRAFT_432231 [Selaginella moellendorffii]